MSKDQFNSLISTITSACEGVDEKYAQMIDAARPFDRELVRVLEQCHAADKAALQYVRSKTEAGQQLPITLIAGLLGR